MGARPTTKTKPQHSVAYRQMCKRLREMREAARLTQRDVAKKLKKPHSTVYKIEHGERRIDPIEFIRWCRVCGVDPGGALNQLRA